MIPPDVITLLKYGAVATALAAFTVSVLNYFDVRRSQVREDKREVSEINVEDVKFLSMGSDPPKPKSLAEVLEELIMRRLADVDVSLTVEIPDTTIKLFGKDARLSGKVTITTRNKHEGSDYPVVVEEDEAEV